MPADTRRTRPLSVALVLALIGTLLTLGATLTPASSHVTGNIKHLWAKHIKPKTDKRYYTKKASNKRFLTPSQADARYKPATLPLGGTLSGVWGAEGRTGVIAGDSITFDPPLPAAVTPTILGPGATNAACPGVGQAQPGNLCVYAGWVNDMSPYLGGFADPTSNLMWVGTRGTRLLFQSSGDLGNVRGTWTVRAPLTTARVAPKQQSAPPGPFGN